MLKIRTTFIQEWLSQLFLLSKSFFYPEAKFSIWSLNEFLVEQSLLLFSVFYM